MTCADITHYRRFKRQRRRRGKCAGWLQGDEYAGNDVAVGTEVCGPVDGKDMGPDGHVVITVRGVTETIP